MERKIWNLSWSRNRNFTYRGYFYDSETNLYYLQSRYYDPETGRFINADDTNYIAYDGTSKSLNIFGYCGNNPINYADFNGKMTVTLSNKAMPNVIMKFAKKVNGKWEISNTVKSKEYVLGSKLGATLYIGASASTSLSAMENKITKSNGNLKLAPKCSLSYKKGAVRISKAIKYKGYTVKAPVALGTVAIAYVITIITSYKDGNKTCYFAFDLGLRINHLTTLGATVVVAGICVAVPYIAPALGSIYTAVIASAASATAFTSGITAIAGYALTIAGQLA